MLGPTTSQASPTQIIRSGRAQHREKAIELGGVLLGGSMWCPGFLARGPDLALASASFILRRGFQMGGWYAVNKHGELDCQGEVLTAPDSSACPPPHACPAFL